jgi:hypothetical protein
MQLNGKSKLLDRRCVDQILAAPLPKALHAKIMPWMCDFNKCFINIQIGNIPSKGLLS